MVEEKKKVETAEELHARLLKEQAAADKELVKAYEARKTGPLLHSAPVKEVKESTGEKRNEAVAGINVGKKPKFQPHV